jgi:hypothetical protein
MTIVETARPLIARAFLFQDATEADAGEVLANRLGERHVARSALGGLGRLSGSALRAVNRELATAANGLIELDLGDALVSGWRKYSDLTRAAERTLAVPGSQEVVVLASHRVIWTNRPHIDLLVDGKKITTIDFELQMVFDVHGVIAVVRLGELVALRSGDCTIAARLTVEGQPLAQHQARMNIALVVRVDPTVPLLGATAPANAGIAVSGSSVRKRPTVRRA